MKKLLSAGILLTIIASSSGAAEMQSRDNPSPPAVVNKPIIYEYGRAPDRSDPGFVVLDVLIYRPFGVALTALGTAVFVAMSPLTALASIPEPHDAFEKTYQVLIRTPVRYTFVRPVGDKSLSPYGAFYDLPSVKRETRYDYDLLPAIGVPIEAPHSTKAETLRRLESKPSETVR